ncbi:MAG: MFS transporter [Proteobacteria bacterium]|nr:MFS transporter [Pseudomonadota bacterium]
MMTQKYKYLPFFMWSFPVVFFAYQFILRLWPGLMIQQIMERFSVDATQFGVFASFYYYGYAGAQIPVALLLDRYRPRFIISSFALVCGLGMLLFIYTNIWSLACISRFLIGVGSAVGFLGVSKVISEWFPKGQYAKMVGFSFTFGLMGAIYGGKPIGLFLETYGWKSVGLTLALVSMSIGLCIYIFLKDPSGHQRHTPEEEESFKASHLKVLLSPIIWLLAAANFLMVGGLEGFSDVWGVSYLMMVYDIPKHEAAQFVSFLFGGMLFGGPFLAFCSRKLGIYTVIALCGVGLALTLGALLLNYKFAPLEIMCLLFLAGVFCCYQVVIFAAGSELVKPLYLGITIAFLNCINMLGGSFFHTLIGYMMDKAWIGTINQEGGRIYDVMSYQIALTLIPICALIGSGIVCLLKIKLKREKIKV